MLAWDSLRVAIANHFLPNRDRETLTTLARAYWDMCGMAIPAPGPEIGCHVRQINLDREPGFLIGDIFESHMPHRRRLFETDAQYPSTSISGAAFTIIREPRGRYPRTLVLRELQFSPSRT